MSNKTRNQKKLVITGKKVVSSPLVIPDDTTLVIAGELTIDDDEQELTEKSLLSRSNLFEWKSLDNQRLYFTLLDVAHQSWEHLLIPPRAANQG